jgi:hypothetical protein
VSVTALQVIRTNLQLRRRQKAQHVQRRQLAGSVAAHDAEAAHRAAQECVGDAAGTVCCGMRRWR